MHRSTCSIVCLILIGCPVHATSAADEFSRYVFPQPHMGTQFVLRFYAPSGDLAERAAAAAMARVAELDDRLSDYQADSELSRLSRTSGSGASIEVSDDLWNVLSTSRQVSDASGGAFDVTVGPYVRLWRRARQTGQFPSDRRLSRARDSVGYRLIEMDQDKRSAKLTKRDMRLDLGGIAKGYAADQALQVLREHGIQRALVDAGGDLAIGDPPPGERGWRIAIASVDANSKTPDLSDRRPSPSPPPPERGRGPGGGGDAEEERQEQGGRGQGIEETDATQAATQTILILSNCGVATSGDAYQFVEFEGRRYSHIVDPRTGVGVLGSSSATVVAPNGMMADALASAVSVLGPDKGIALVEKSPGAAVLVVTAKGEKVRRHCSNTMDELLHE